MRRACWEALRRRACDRRAGARIRVETLEARTLLTVYMVMNTADSGPGSLRQAILDADFNPGADTIDFNVGSGGPVTIAPTSELPQILDAVTIDGTSQPGYAGKPIVEINGANAGQGANGILIGSGHTTVEGLVINRFNGSAIRMENNGGNIIQGNYLGTDITGTSALGNNVDGVLIINSPNNMIGGTTAALRNVISGNHAVGIRITGAGATGNVVEGNFIGINAAGTAALGNVFDGVLVDSAPSNAIGGPTLAARNIISGNGATGIRLTGSSTTGNLVQNNAIGTKADGIGPLGNASDGVLVISSANNNLIGGLDANLGNVIAFNSGAGVVIVGSTGDAILSNSIYSNVFLGIDIGSNGVNLHNLPSLISAFRVGTSTIVQGTLSSTPSSSFTLQFFASLTPGPSGYGGGQTLLGTVPVTTNSAGSATFRFSFALTLPSLDWVTTTAIDALSNTSEFSHGVPYQFRTAS